MQLIGEPSGRIAPADELVNSFEFEAMAKRKLDSIAYAEVAGGDRQALDRITFRPRMMVNTTKLDMTCDLLGQKMFAPILVGPVSQLKRFHPEGDLAMARGAAAAKAVMVVADKSSYPIEEIAKEPNATLWYQVYPGADIDAVRARADKAIAAGCKAVCVTVGVPTLPEVSWDWAAIDKFRKGLTVPVVLKGVMTAEDAKAAIQHGLQGIVVSNYAGNANNAMAASIEVLPAIADAVAGRIPVLADGNYRRGGDVLMALALGAKAVMVSRPAVWGLAPYGADGVQKIMELLHTELARTMAMNGRLNLKAVDKTVVKIHRW
jgi:isopentenyl diphosphate isomerase/L-lactate dehydrogenase-like FMN-dependent dehydrogenase